MSTKHTGRARFIRALVVALALLMGAAVQAQDAPPTDPDKGGAEAPARSRTIVWFLDTRGLETDEARKLAADIPKVLGQIVGDGADKHIVAMSAKALGKWLDKTPRPTPPCLQGLAPCPNPEAVLMEALSADLLIRGRLTTTGPRWTLKIKMHDPTGKVVLQRTFEEGGVSTTGEPSTLDKGLEKVAFTAVRELFKSTGGLTITSNPPGAEVVLDGEIRGVTPLVMELPIGVHKVELKLPDHTATTREAKVSAGQDTVLDVALSARMATLTVDSTPILGDVYIDNKKLGTAGTPMQLAPGEYELEVKAEGFKTRTQRLLLEPEEMKIVSLTLEQARPQLYIKGLGEVETEAILARNYYARVAYRFSSLSTGLSEGEGQLDSQILRIDGLSGADTNGQRDFGFHGIHLDLGYNWEYWGLVGLGLSIFSSGDRAETNLKGPSGVIEGAELDDFTRLEIKPAQLTFRYPYKNLFPSVQTGFGYFSNAFTADAGDAGKLDMAQDGFFWHFSIEATYFFDTWWYGFASLGIQRDLSHDDSDTQMHLGFGAGIAFENPLTAFGAGPAEPPKDF